MKKIEEQIAWLRDVQDDQHLGDLPFADTMQALLDVAKAADYVIPAWFEEDGCHRLDGAMDELAEALAKL